MRFQWMRWAAAALSAALVLVSGQALAERDTFFLGTGRDGALTVTAAGTVINSYAQVVAPLAGGDTSISVSTPSGAGLKSGDLVMVLQTTGLVTIPASGSSTAVGLNLTDVGRWELARLASVTTAMGGATLSLTVPLVYSYAAQVTQVIRIPEYSNVQINSGATIEATPWDGAKGGIIAFLAQGTVTNNGKILATGVGFRGGQPANDTTGSLGCTGLDEAAPKGAQKGEGFANIRYGASHTGRGNVGNGGGGGVCLQSGGGGGGNGNAGGQGGYSNNVKDWPAGTIRDVGGLPGSPVQFTVLSRLGLGGGGGAGHGAKGSAGSGGAGGGIVFVRANALAGTGTIEADGAVGSSSAGGDGGGGAGAGGTIYARFATTASCGGLRAQGGIGGDSYNPDTTYVGPGGGGGGGVVLRQSTGGTCNAFVLGGGPGFKQDSSPYGSNFGAAQGSKGLTEFYTSGFAVPSEPVLETPVEGSSNSVLFVSGTGPAGGTTYIFIDGTLVGGTSIGSTGRFGTTIPKQPADGPHRIEVAAEYLGAWSSTTAARNFTLDTVAPPTPVILVPAPDSWVASTTPTFSGTAEPLSKLSLNVSTRGNFTATTDASGHWSFTMPSALDDGLDYILSVRATDAASNGSDLATVSFMVDATVPETTLGQTPSDPSTSSSTTFTFSSNETGAGFECSVDDAAFTACTSPATFTLSDGQHTFQVRARDLAGNVDATPASFSWTLDTGAPDVTITEKPASVTNATSAKLVFGSTDRGSSFECSVDGAAFSSCTSPVDLTGLAEGKHSFKVQARDVVGNVSTAPATWEWTVDVTAPVAPVITAPTEGQAFESGTVSITGTAEAGSKVRVFIKGTEAGSVTADGSGNWSFTPATAFANGSYTVKATATDAANNVSAESGERTFTVDVKSPGTGGGGDEPESCGCSSPAGDPASALMALAGLAAFVSRRRRK